MLALVPVMTIVYLGLAYLPEFGVLAEQVERFVFQNFVPSSSAAVQAKLNEFADRAGDLTTLGLIGLTVTALGLLLSIERHFNALWQVSMPRLSLRRLVVVLGLLTIGPSLVLTALWVSTYLLSPPLLATLDVIGVAPFAGRIAAALFVFGVQYFVQGRTKCHGCSEARVVWRVSVSGGL